MMTRRDDRLLRTIKPDLPNPGKKGRWVSRVVFDPGGRMLAFATGDSTSVDPADRGGAWVWLVPESTGRRGSAFVPWATTAPGPSLMSPSAPAAESIAVAG